MKKFSAIPKVLAIATVIGVMGYAYAQTSNTRPAAELDPTTGSPAQRSDVGNDAPMGTRSTNNNNVDTNMERPARADRN